MPLIAKLPPCSGLREITILSLTGKTKSILAKYSDVVMDVSVKKEA